MDVSHTEHSHVIGKGGNNIKRVMEETGCHIHFPDSNRNNQAEKSNQVCLTAVQISDDTDRRSELFTSVWSKSFSHHILSFYLSSHSTAPWFSPVCTALCCLQCLLPPLLHESFSSVVAVVVWFKAPNRSQRVGPVGCFDWRKLVCFGWTLWTSRRIRL